MKGRIEKNKTLLFAIAAMLVIVILIAALIAAPTHVNNLLGFVTHMPVFTAHVPTPSMFPTINQGDVIFVDTRIKFVDVMLNDIIVFDAPVGMTVHRVIEVGNGTLITQGDNNPNPDGLPVTEQTYVGSVSFILENGSHYAVLILGCILGLSARDTWLRIKRKQNKRAIVNKDKWWCLKSWRRLIALVVIIGYVMPACILMLGPTDPLTRISAYTVVAMFTVFFIIIGINVKSGDPDKMLLWVNKNSTLGMIMIIVGSAVGTAVVTVDPAYIKSDSESEQLQINIIRSVLIAVFTGVMSLLFALWFSHKSAQKLHIRLDRIDKDLFDISRSMHIPYFER